MTPAEAQDVLERCRIGVFVAQSFAVRIDRAGYEEEVDTEPVRHALGEIQELLPIADPSADEDLRRGCSALEEATELVENAGATKLPRRERRRLNALDKEGVEHLSAALTRLSALANLRALPVELI
jgi:hypothetical protein